MKTNIFIQLIYFPTNEGQDILIIWINCEMNQSYWNKTSDPSLSPFLYHWTVNGITDSTTHTMVAVLW